MKKKIFGLMIMVISLTLAPSAIGGGDLPDSISAIGDSITLAYNLGFLRMGAHPEHSWSTGNAFDVVRSHFERIKWRNPDMTSAYNNAAVGATVADVRNNQLPKTLAQNPEYVTVMVGSNDACFGTDLDLFQDHYSAVVHELTTNLPEAQILLVGNPDIARLKEILGGRRFCRFIWQRFNVCPPLLTSGDQFTAFREQVIKMNKIIANIANEAGDRVQYADVHSYKFSPYQISNLDCFHPSIFGEAKLANLTWQQGFFQ